ncbi:hypothetical protein C3942_13390 [Solimonas fluminis]|uniref:Bacterial Ig domain-containing protein n=1 Tax=Solimonas fluminis TaxID=2086571 RepID=A0A2S5TE46_9GAMM|nr:hypothetical protein [Solimonas fluminis]PPE73264.1 hypothetical protein C3942_13390 [Solimonas fluminis]
MSKILRGLLLLGLASVAACSDKDDGGPDTTPPPAPTKTVSGVAAVGAAISGGRISVRCADGGAYGVDAAANGSWNVAAVPEASLPCAIRITGGSAGGLPNTSTFYSLATTREGVIIVNITPLTDLALARAVGGNLDTWFDGSGASRLTDAAAALPGAIAALRADLAGAGYAVPAPAASFDPFLSPLEPGTPTDPYDALLDRLGEALRDEGRSYAQLRADFTGPVEGNVLPPPTEDPEPEPAGPLAQQIGAVFAGDYVLSCPSEGGPVTKTVAIAADGSSRLDGAVAVGAGQGGTIELSGSNFVAPAIVIRRADGLSIRLQFNADGDLASGQASTSGQGPGCTAVSGEASLGSLSVSALIGSLARTQTLNCGAAATGTPVLNGATGYTLAANGAMTLGSLAISEAQYQDGGYTIKDGASFPGAAPGNEIELFSANSGPGGSVLYMTLFTDADGDTAKVSYRNFGSDRGECLPPA